MLQTKCEYMYVLQNTHEVGVHDFKLQVKMCVKVVFMV